MEETLRVTYEPKGTTAVLTVGGVDVSRLVSRVTVDQTANDVPRVFLELKPGAAPDSIDVEGVVQVREVVEEDAAQATLRFLEPISPDEFERDVLESMEMGGPQSFGLAALEVLKGYAGGN